MTKGDEAAAPSSPSSTASIEDPDSPVGTARSASTRAGGRLSTPAAPTEIDDSDIVGVAAAEVDMVDTDGTDVAGESSDVPLYGSIEEALEDAVTSLEQVSAERDEYLELARRVQAEFENYRKRVDGQRIDYIARAAESLVSELLPVLDGGDAALGQGITEIEPIHSMLLTTLVKQGLTLIEAEGAPFDPNLHEAVMSEPAEKDDDGPVVAEVLRTGYQWNGRVIRPAMVKVRG